MHKKQVLLLAMLLLSAQGALVARTSPGGYEKETRHNIVARQNNNDNNNDNGNNNNNNNNENNNGNNKNDKSQESTTSQPTTAPKSSQQASSTDATTTEQKSTETSSTNTPSSTQTTSTDSTTTSPPSSSTTSTPTTSSSSSSSESDLPSLSTATTDVPTPVVTIPSMDNNPYLIRSNLPEGTVFIAVGAIFGGLALAVMAWRMFASMSLRRSLKRYGNATGSGPQMSSVAAGQDQKRMFYPGDPSRAGDPTNMPPTDEFQRRAPSLFFSPTAEVMNSATNAAHNQGSMSSTFGNNARSSVYLPAGYYTPGGANAGATGSMTSRTTRHMSMGNGGARESMYGGLAPSVRTSTLNGPRNGDLQHHHQPQQRAPSAYLDDLLGHDND